MGSPLSFGLFLLLSNTSLRLSKKGWIIHLLAFITFVSNSAKNMVSFAMHEIRLTLFIIEKNTCYFLKRNLQ